jgi:hypothetical protein
MNDPRDFSGRTPPPREPDERLADWVDGCMSDRERERFTAELRVNPQLRADLAAYERTVATLREALRAPTAPLPRRELAAGGTTLADRVLAQVQGAAPARSLRRAGGGIAWRPVLWSLASAAALLMLTLLLDSWSAEPSATSDSAVLSLDASTAKQAATDPAGRPPEPVSEPAKEFRREQLVTSARSAGKPEAPADPAGQAAAPAASEAVKPAEVRALGGVEPPSGAAVVSAPEAPATAPPAPTPDAPRSASELAENEYKDKRVVVDERRAPAAGAPPGRGEPAPGRLAGASDPANPVIPGQPAAGSQGTAGEVAAPEPTAADRERPLADSSRAGSDDFYLGSKRKSAAPPWPVLRIDGVEAAPAPATAGGRGAAPPAGAGTARGAVSGPSGPATGGPAGPVAPGSTVTPGSAVNPASPADLASPVAGGAAALSQAQLVARIDAFLAAAVQADAAPVLVLTTANGTLRLVRLPVAAAPSDQVPPPAAKAESAPAALEANWAVEGPQDDVAVLLRRLDLFARAPGRSLSSGEVAAPTLPPPSASVVAPTAQRQLVLQFRLRPR